MNASHIPANILGEIFRYVFFQISGSVESLGTRSRRFYRTFKNFWVIFEASRNFIRSNCSKTLERSIRTVHRYPDVAGARKARTGPQAWIQPVSHRDHANYDIIVRHMPPRSRARNRSDSPIRIGGNLASGNSGFS